MSAEQTHREVPLQRRKQDRANPTPLPDPVEMQFDPVKHVTLLEVARITEAHYSKKRCPKTLRTWMWEIDKPVYATPGSTKSSKTPRFIRREDLQSLLNYADSKSYRPGAQKPRKKRAEGEADASPVVPPRKTPARAPAGDAVAVAQGLIKGGQVPLHHEDTVTVQLTERQKRYFAVTGLDPVATIQHAVDQHLDRLLDALSG